VYVHIGSIQRGGRGRRCDSFSLGFLAHLHGDLSLNIIIDRHKFLP
jgi:hypothetical protein